MSTTTACRKRCPFSGAAVAWSLAVVFLLAVASPPLYACDDGTAVPNPGDNPGLVADCKVLLALRDELAGTGSLNWNPQLAMTSWHGIHVTGSPGRVTVLIIARQVAGAIPARLGQLAELERLDLSRNQLTGPIPVELGQLTGLEWLGLSGNQLTGLIPAELGQPTQLQTLSLAGNQLAGAIPAELSQLSRLEQLGLGGNQLTELLELHLQHNQLTGLIPGELGQLSNLREFSFRGNRLAEPIPQELRHLPDLYVLNLAASWVAPGQMKVFWDDSGDPTASYEYRLFDPVQHWTGWAEIADSEITLGADEEETIEWTLTVSPDYSVDRFRIVYGHIEIRARNREGTSPQAIAIVRALEGSGITSNTDQPQVDIPYCLEHQFRLFWENTPCATVAVLPQVVMGVLGGNTAAVPLLSNPLDAFRSILGPQVESNPVLDRSLGGG